jgi:hypothetical protein
MPDGATHKLIGASGGCVFAAYRAKDQNPGSWIAELAGGAIGGYVGGILPDILEPAISSWHRGVAHSYVGGATVVATAIEVLSKWEIACRTNAENCKATPAIVIPGGMFVAAPPDPVYQFLSSLAELFWRLMAGFLNGLVAGYVSHLALDAITPRSIPLLASGF